MVTHVTRYQAALFEGLVDDWAALDKWDINDAQGRDYMRQAFGEDFLLETLDVKSYLYGGHRTSAEREYATFDEIMGKINGRTTNKKYVKKGGLSDGKPTSLLLNQEVPDAIKGDIAEPKVTNQILDLNSVSMSILEQGTISVVQADDNE